MIGNRHLHPSRKKLTAWLEGDEPSIDAHIADCHRCADRIEEISQGEMRPLAAALSAVLAPPSDLRPRLNRGITRKMQSRGDLTLVGELLGVSWRTVRVISQGASRED